MTIDQEWPRLVPAAGRVIRTRKPGATATEDDRARAMEYLACVNTDFWNPWRRDDEADQMMAARAILDQWDESGGATQEEIDAWMEASDHCHRRKWQQREQEREQRKLAYDPDQETDRLALLEAESLLFHTEEERTSMIGGIRLSAMAADRRASETARLEQEHGLRTRRVDELRARVPDPESVTDRHGWLPADRRVWRKSDFECRRHTAVTDLRQQLLDAQAELEATPKGQRREPLARIRGIQAKLDLWLGIAEPEVAQMCSECSTPLAWHVWSSGGLEALIGYGPCPAYPGQRVIYQRVMAIFEASTARKTLNRTSPPDRKQHDPRTKAQLLEEIDRLQTQIAEQTPP
jgi:hypothetical protein